jgi:hypothetical protein
MLEVVTQTVAARAAVSRILCRIKARELSVAFDTFSSIVADICHTRAIVSRSVIRMRLASVCWSFELWCRYIAESQQLQRGEVKEEGLELAKLEMQARADACEAAERARALAIDKAELQGEIEAEKCRRLVMARRVVVRLLHSQLAAAFDAFFWRVRDVKEVKQTRERVLARMAKSSLAVGFDGYRASVAATRANRAAVTRVITRMLKATLIFGFHAWVDMTEDIKTSRNAAAGNQATSQLREMLQKEEERNKCRTQQDARRRMDHCARMVRRMKAARLAAAFECFRQASWQKSAARAAAGRVVCRMQNHLLSSSFDNFVNSVVDLKARRSSADQVIMRLLFGELSRAMAAWREYVMYCRLAAAEEGLELAKKTMTGQIDEGQALQDGIQREKERRLAMCRRMMARARARLTAMAWCRYTDQVSTRVEQRRLVGYVLQRMYRVSMARAFDAFVSAVEQVMMEREAVTRAISRWRLPCLQWGFEALSDAAHLQREHEKDIKDEGWCLAREAMQRELDSNIQSNRTTQQLQEDLLQKERLRRTEICRRSIRRILRANLVRTFVAFRFRTSLCRQRRLLSSKIVRRMLQIQAARAFAGFMSAVKRAARVRQTCARVIIRVNIRILARAFEAYLCCVEGAQMRRLEEENQARQNELLKDVLAGTAIGQVLKAKTLQELALAEVLEEKKLLLKLLVAQEEKLAQLENELGSLKELLASLPSNIVIPDLTRTDQAESYRRELLQRCRRMLTSALNIPDFDADALLEHSGSISWLLAPESRNDVTPNTMLWSPEEDAAIMRAQSSLGNKWNEIALQEEALRGKNAKAIQALPPHVPCRLVNNSLYLVFRANPAPCPCPHKSPLILVCAWKRSHAQADIESNSPVLHQNRWNAHLLPHLNAHRLQVAAPTCPKGAARAADRPLEAAPFSAQADDANAARHRREGECCIVQQSGAFFEQGGRENDSRPLPSALAAERLSELDREREEARKQVDEYEREKEAARVREENARLHAHKTAATAQRDWGFCVSCGKTHVTGEEVEEEREGRYLRSKTRSEREMIVRLLLVRAHLQPESCARRSSDSTCVSDVMLTASELWRQGMILRAA